MSNITEGLRGPDYLGDGVYVGHDGYQIWLCTERDEQVHKIALDQSTMAALERYKTRVMEGGKHVD